MMTSVCYSEAEVVKAEASAVTAIAIAGVGALCIGAAYLGMSGKLESAIQQWKQSDTGAYLYNLGTKIANMSTAVSTGCSYIINQGVNWAFKNGKSLANTLSKADANDIYEAMRQAGFVLKLDKDSANAIANATNVAFSVDNPSYRSRIEFELLPDSYYEGFLYSEPWSVYDVTSMSGEELATVTTGFIEDWCPLYTVETEVVARSSTNSMEWVTGYICPLVGFPLFSDTTYSLSTMSYTSLSNYGGSYGYLFNRLYSVNSSMADVTYTTYLKGYDGAEANSVDMTLNRVGCGCVGLTANGLLLIGSTYYLCHYNPSTCLATPLANLTFAPLNYIQRYASSNGSTHFITYCYRCLKSGGLNYASSTFRLFTKLASESSVDIGLTYRTPYNTIGVSTSSGFSGSSLSNLVYALYSQFNLYMSGDYLRTIPVFTATDSSPDEYGRYAYDPDSRVDEPLETVSDLEGVSGLTVYSGATAGTADTDTNIDVGIGDDEKVYVPIDIPHNVSIPDADAEAGLWDATQSVVDTTEVTEEMDDAYDDAETSGATDVVNITNVDIDLTSVTDAINSANYHLGYTIPTFDLSFNAFLTWFRYYWKLGIQLVKLAIGVIPARIKSVLLGALGVVLGSSLYKKLIGG